MRRIKAENLLDTISAVTDTKDKFDGLPVGARAVQIADGTRSTYFLTTFGRATRETPCSCEVKMEPTLSQALHLLNGGTVNDKIRQGGLIAQAHRARSPPRRRITELYIRCFSRKPDKEELAKLVPVVAQPRTRPRRLKTSSGRCSTAVNSCSTIDRRPLAAGRAVGRLVGASASFRKCARSGEIRDHAIEACGQSFFPPAFSLFLGAVSAGLAADPPKEKSHLPGQRGRDFSQSLRLVPQPRQAEGGAEPG